MKQQTENLTAAESLQLINDMIIRARKSFSKSSFHFLLWGWILIAAGIGEYLLEHVFMYSHFYIVWGIAGFGGGLVAMIYEQNRQNKNEGANAWSDRVMGWLWGSFVLTLVVIIALSLGTGTRPAFFILALTGLPTMVTGALLGFLPLKIGGGFFWLFALLAWFVFPDQVALIFSLAVFCGYLIPGMLLKKEESNE